MSNLKKGLAAIKAYQEEQKAKAEAANRPKAAWFSSVFPKELGDTVEVLFLQELDEDSENFNAERGQGIIAVEHTAPGPDGYKRRGLCTLESDGQCYACERHSARVEADKGGWRQRQNLYINVAVKVKGEVKVFVLSRNANSSFTDSLVQEAVDEGSITNAMYRITKTGSGTQTNWLLKRLPKAELLDVSGVECFDLEETAIRSIDYDKQAEYYGAVYGGGATASDEGSASSSAPADEEW